MGPCHPENEDFEVDWRFFFMYSVVFVAGLLGNVIIFWAYHFWHQRVLGKRASSAFLLRSLNACDLITCLFLLINLATRHYENKLLGLPKPPAVGIFNSCRNVLIACAMFTLALIGLDRALAVCCPWNSSWSDTKAKWCLFLFASGTIGSDLCVRLVILYPPSDAVACWTETIYNYIYGAASLLVLIFIYVCYGVLFVSAYGFWQRTERRRTETINRTRAWTLGRVHATSVDSDINLSISSEQYISPSCEESTLSTISQTIPTRLHTTPSAWSSSQETVYMEERQAQKRLICVLFSITVSQTISVVPLFLFNATFIDFPGYILYYFFYLNCFTNPLIYFITRDELRNYLLCLVRDPIQAFTYHSR